MIFIISKKSFFEHKHLLDDYVFWKKTDDDNIEVKTNSKFTIDILTKIKENDND